MEALVRPRFAGNINRQISGGEIVQKFAGIYELRVCCEISQSFAHKIEKSEARVSNQCRGSILSGGSDDEHFLPSNSVGTILGEVPCKTRARIIV